MKNRLWAVLSSLAIAGPLHAQTKDRWRLDWSAEKPQVYTHRNPLDQRINFWFITYTLSNPTDQVVPLILDIMLYTEAGKELMHDVKKADPRATREAADSRGYEREKFGTFYSNVIAPEVENSIIEYHAKLGNRSPGIVRESIEAFKKADRYLNAREIRQKRVLKPGESCHGLAIFQGVDARGKILEVQVSGLYDIIRIEQFTEEDVRMNYENRVYVVRYAFPGDEYDRPRDFLDPDLLQKIRDRWVIKRIGPVASKDTLENLVSALVASLRNEKQWVEEQLPPGEVEKLRQKEGITSLDLRIIADTFRLATGQAFGYDRTQAALPNEKAIWRIHEWWLTNKPKLLFNELLNRYEVKDEDHPGTKSEK